MSFQFSRQKKTKRNPRSFTTEDTEGTEKGQIKGLGFGLICEEHDNQRPIALLVLKSKA